MQDDEKEQEEKLDVKEEGDANSDFTIEEENREITALSGRIGRSNLYRRSFFAILALVLAGVAFHLFGPNRKAHFNVLDALSYEALMLERSEDESRIDFPADSLSEVNDYFAKSPNLGFVPSPLRQAPHNFHPEGASIIDYGDLGSVLVVQFRENEDNKRAYFFEMRGNPAQLPKSSELTEGNLHLKTYGNDHFNIVVWQKNSESMALLFGKSSVKHLAELAASCQ